MSDKAHPDLVPGALRFRRAALLLLGIGIPVAGFLTLVAREAVQVSQGAEGWIQSNARYLEQASEPGGRGVDPE